MTLTLINQLSICAQINSSTILTHLCAEILASGSLTFFLLVAPLVVFKAAFVFTIVNETKIS